MVTYASKLLAKRLFKGPKRYGSPGSRARAHSQLNRAQWKEPHPLSKDITKYLLGRGESLPLPVERRRRTHVRRSKVNKMRPKKDCEPEMRLLWEALWVLWKDFVRKRAGYKWADTGPFEVLNLKLGERVADDLGLFVVFSHSEMMSRRYDDAGCEQYECAVFRWDHVAGKIVVAGSDGEARSRESMRNFLKRNERGGVTWRLVRESDHEVLAQTMCETEYFSEEEEREIFGRVLRGLIASVCKGGKLVKGSYFGSAGQ
ncbi:hypothetical protein FA15DRAFT_727466 [Coprinopsis marcescibilis]|uniref:Uncharacterized protein n=1 Tax=Coprinopsis marcescibilis TaxID=230819 RepID=A0A5C3KFZ3_COPMA|nr:hypothetical protein FA15DRAFT_727466 [Coprinopsis marcescibilis]